MLAVEERREMTEDELREKLERYERMIASAEWIEFGRGRRIAQPCDQPAGKQCWHDENENLFNTALEAFESLVDYKTNRRS